ncbi:hypothetical protein [Prosthecobacter sp.]|uniref:hypothetical protein n=1 Tax=Prosthecobacter sp. TaxID=1965333 RepID=UPI002ABB4D3A|nr:hypothetical protein [Prosthecobacter sp.]MDZ4404413.1 hypothetical protein [Prosthecobacter sp.]
MDRSLLILIATSLLAAAPLQAAGDKPGPAAYVTIETRDMTIEFAGDRAWTISRILHKGAVITGRTGFYGTVFSPVGGKWIGTGHNEGGIEKVERAVLTVDGKPCELKDKAVYRGHHAELRKQSMMGALRLEAVYAVMDDRVIEQHRYEATEEVKIGVLYGFMHPFLPSTTEWMAEEADGTAVEGVFDSQGGHRLREDVKWTAIHDPKSQRATLVWYPKPLVGQGMKTFYWDKTVYHKLYNHIYSNATIATGTKFEAEVVLRCVETDTATWKEKTRTLAKEMNAAAK